MRDAAALFRVGRGVDRLRVEETLDEPRRGAVCEALELGHAEGRARAELLEHEGVRDPRRPLEGSQGAREPPLPAVRARKPLRCLGVAGGELRQCSQPLPLGRRFLEGPGQR